MQQDEFFPLDAIPPRVRRAILQEFQGRRPTVQEVAQVSDRHWLATPEVGPSTLEKIHEVLQPQPCQGDGALPKMTDAELLDRLEYLQEELRSIRHILKTRIGKTSGKLLWNQGRMRPFPDEEAGLRLV
jgi:hypothetical protein